jgi:hypothetical protein
MARYCEDLNETRETATSKHGLGIWIWIVIILVAYVFSLGPVAAFCRVRIGNNDRANKITLAAEVFYAPLVLLVDTPVDCTVFYETRMSRPSYQLVVGIYSIFGACNFGADSL